MFLFVVYSLEANATSAGIRKEAQNMRLFGATALISSMTASPEISGSPSLIGTPSSAVIRSQMSSMGASPSALAAKQWT